MKHLNKIVQGDCLELLLELPENSIDLMVTDPPYGVGFMGKKWDKAVPAIDIWRECLRVLKPGAFAFVMSLPRQDVLSRMIVNLEDAGFNTNFTSLYWTYATGFPKAMNMGKAMDKQNGRNEAVQKEFTEYLTKNIKASGKTRKQIQVLLNHKANGGGLLAHWIGESSQPTIPTKNDWNKLKRIFNLDNSWDWFIERIGAEREIIGKKKTSSPLKGFFVPEREHRQRVQLYDTSPSTLQAKTFDGSYAGFQPKPAVEVILVAMKPLSEKNYVEQALNNGKGITWLDDGRIPFKKDRDYETTKRKCKGIGKTNRDKCFSGYANLTEEMVEKEGYRYKADGRFPANLLVSDDVLDDGKVTVSRASDSNYVQGNNNNPTSIVNNIKSGEHHADAGQFSRYFSLDSWWQHKLKSLPESVRKTFPFLLTPKASNGEKKKGTTNIHTTVKPLQLMSYLITIGSRTNDIVLDPFCGSGTTGLAATLLHRKYIGFELERDYVEIANKRMTHELKQNNFLRP